MVKMGAPTRNRGAVVTQACALQIKIGACRHNLVAASICVPEQRSGAPTVRPSDVRLDLCSKVHEQDRDPLSDFHFLVGEELTPFVREVG